MPFIRFNVRLFSETAGKVVPAPLPPILIFVELPPVNVPAVVVIAPFRLKVFAPIAKAPIVSVNVPGIEKSPFSVNPLLLLTFRPSAILLTNAPAGMLWTDDPENTTTDEVAVASICAPFVKTRSPVIVSCFPFTSSLSVACALVISPTVLF
jgi:hypothetical protein